MDPFHVSQFSPIFSSFKFSNISGGREGKVDGTIRAATVSISILKEEEKTVLMVFLFCVGLRSELILKTIYGLILRVHLAEIEVSTFPFLPFSSPLLHSVMSSLLFQDSPET